jgi:hypothetical protein
MNKQDTGVVSDSIVKLLCESPLIIRGGNGFLTSEISLLPIIAELEQASAIDGEDVKDKRVNDLDLRIISTMVYAIGNQISSVRVLPSIMKECHAVIDIVVEEISRCDGLTHGERVKYLAEFQSFCEELAKWAEESISAGDINQTEVLHKFNSYLNLLKRRTAMLILYLKELEKTVKRGEKALLRKEVEQREKAVRQREGAEKSFLLSLFDESMPNAQIPLAEKSARTELKGKRRKRTVSSNPSPQQMKAYRLVHVEGKTRAQAAIEMRCSPQNISELLKIAEAKVSAQPSRSVNLAKAQALPEDKRGQVNISERDT